MSEPIQLEVSQLGFEQLYRTEYPALLGVAAALTGSFEDGEDVVHDTMVRALGHWSKVQRLQRPGGWCHRVLVNLCRGRWRRARVAARYLARQRREELTVAGPTPEVVAFWAAVRQLPERPRLVVAMYYAGDRSVEDVARILDVPEGTVRSDLTRAREVLRRELEV